MSRSVIKDIFNGFTGNQEAMPLKKENKENLKRVSDCYDELKESFSVKQINLIEKFLSAYDKNCCDEVDFYFVEGFKLGLRIGFECFEDNE